MWKVYVNPATKQLDVFDEEGREVRALLNVSLSQDWGSEDSRHKYKLGFVEVSFTGLAELVFERPKKND
jgi:hypothetical protein